MKIQHKYNMIIMGIIIFLFYNCNHKIPIEFVEKEVPVYSSNDEFLYLKKQKEPFPYYDTTKILQGVKKLYYNTGELKDSSFWKDNELMNERFLFYKTGQLMEYRFYNCQGQLMYTREYDELGVITHEIGEPYIQVLTHTNVCTGDSSLSSIYIASPPNCIHNIYVIEKDSTRDNVTKRFTHPTNYIYSFYRKFKKEGSFILPLELEFIDTLTNKRTINNCNISYEVRNCK